MTDKHGWAPGYFILRHRACRFLLHEDDGGGRYLGVPSFAVTDHTSIVVPSRSATKLEENGSAAARSGRRGETRQLEQREIRGDSSAEEGSGGGGGAEKNGDGLLSFRHEIANLVPENLDTAIQARKRPSTFIVIISIPLLRRPFPSLLLRSYSPNGRSYLFVRFCLYVRNC